VTPPRAHPFLRRHAGKLVASALITIGLIYTVRSGGLKLIPSGEDFASVRWWGIVLYVPCVLGMTWFRSVRWRFLLRAIKDVPKRRLLAVSCAGFAAILLLPFRIGEFARPYLLRTRPEERRPGEPVLTMTATTSSIVAERVIDGLFLCLVLAAVLLWVPTIQPMPENVVGLRILERPISMASVRGSAFVLLGVFAVAFVTIAVFYFARAWAHRATLAVIGKVSVRLAEKLAGIAEKLSDGLHVFGRGRDALGFLVETTLYWGFNALGMWVLARGCGVIHADGTGLTFPEACGLMGMLGCAILIPGPPGLLGVFQAGIYAGLTMYVPAAVVSGSGAAYVFLVYLIQVVLQLSFGAWGLWHEGGARRLRGMTEAQAQAEDEAAADAA